MRVLHVGKFFPPFSGGIENFMWDLLAACAARKVDQMAVVHHHRPGAVTLREQVRTGRNGPVEIVRVRSFGQVLYAPVAPGFGRAMEEAARAFRPDLVHVHMPNLSAFWLLRSRSLRNVPWIVHWHADVAADTMSPGLALAYRAYGPLEQALLKRAARVIVTSPPYLDSSKALAPWREKCVVIPLGLDARRLEATDHRSGAMGDPAFPGRDGVGGGLGLLFVGRLSAYKGLDTLISAVHAVPEVQLVIAGEGEERPTLAALVRRLDLQSRVSLPGHVSDGRKMQLLRDADLLCLPSINRHEAFGLVLVEAMGCGTPVMATRVPGSGMQWVVEEEKTGFLVEPRDAPAIARLFERLGADRRLLANAGIAARETFAHRFDIRPVADAVAGLYESVLTAESPGVEAG
jgi:rhamnosyl/mannosyltransferase